MKLPDIAHRLQKQLLGPKGGELLSIQLDLGGASCEGTILWYWPGKFVEQYVVHSIGAFAHDDRLSVFNGSYFLLGSYGDDEGKTVEAATHEFDRRVVGGG